MQQFRYHNKAGKAIEHESWCIAHLNNGEWDDYYFPFNNGNHGKPLEYDDILMITTYPSKVFNCQEFYEYKKVVHEALHPLVDKDLNFKFGKSVSKQLLLFISTFIRLIDEEPIIMWKTIAMDTGHLIERLARLYKNNHRMDFNNASHQPLYTLLSSSDSESNAKKLADNWWRFISYLNVNGEILSEATHLAHDTPETWEYAQEFINTLEVINEAKPN